MAQETQYVVVITGNKTKGKIYHCGAVGSIGIVYGGLDNLMCEVRLTEDNYPLTQFLFKEDLFLIGEL